MEAFKIDAVPIVNTDYLAFLQQFSTPRLDLFPSSWTTKSNSLKMEDIKIRTLYGDVAFGIGQHWATCASALQLQAFAEVSFFIEIWIFTDPLVIVPQRSITN